MGDIFQKKIDEIFSVMPNIFSNADDILVAGFNEQGKDQDVTLDKVLRIYRRLNLRLTKSKYLSDAPAIHSLVK